MATVLRSCFSGTNRLSIGLQLRESLYPNSVIGEHAQVYPSPWMRVAAGVDQCVVYPPSRPCNGPMGLWPTFRPTFIACT